MVPSVLALKKPALSDPSKYRPILILSFISKLVQRAVHRLLSNYIEPNTLLPFVQSGYRRLHSTETTVLKVYKDVVLALDYGFITALVLLDVSFTFDCVDHSKLLEVLKLEFCITAPVGLLTCPSVYPFFMHACIHSCTQGRKLGSGFGGDQKAYD